MKILDDIKQQVEQEMKKFDPRLAQKKYLKITHSLKEVFLKAVVSEKQSIKKAAQRIGINYSSAKAIWAEFKQKHTNFKRKKNIKNEIKEEESQQEKGGLDKVKRCSYKILKDCHRIKKFFMEIKSSVTQKLTNQSYLDSAVTNQFEQQNQQQESNFGNKAPQDVQR